MSAPYGQVPQTAPPPGQPMTTDDLLLGTLVALLLAGSAAHRIRDLLASAEGTTAQAATYLISRPEIQNALTTPDLPMTDRPVNLQRRQNAFRRAAYLVNATRRLTVAWLLGTQPDVGGHPAKSPATNLPWTGPGDGLSGRARMAVAWEREKNHLASHLLAVSKRNSAARAVATAWLAQGRSGLLGWSARMDRKTSGECREANGRNFDPSRVPPIGFPGAVHPDCRCRAVRPFDTQLRVEDLFADGRMSATVAATRVGWSVRTITT
jgi:hypothetical protein